MTARSKSTDYCMTCGSYSPLRDWLCEECHEDWIARNAAKISNLSEVNGDAENAS